MLLSQVTFINEGSEDVCIDFKDFSFLMSHLCIGLSSPLVLQEKKTQIIAPWLGVKASFRTCWMARDFEFPNFSNNLIALGVSAACLMIIKNRKKMHAPQVTLVQ